MYIVSHYYRLKNDDLEMVSLVILTARVSVFSIHRPGKNLALKLFLKKVTSSPRQYALGKP